MIITGQKPEEYRDITPYYAVRFNRYNGRPFTLRYRAGYRANSPLLQCTATVRQGVGRIEWGAVPGQQYFVLDLRDVQIIEEKKRRGTMKPEEYSTAIIKLLPTAQGNTGGSRVAAQVLLSAYNGNAFQLDIVDLCNLDKEHYAAALGVIRGRVELGIEPHTLVNNGDKIFEDLWLKWERYHVTNRGIPDCYFCYGTGMVYADETGGDELKQCPECDGKGFVLDKPQR